MQHDRIGGTKWVLPVEECRYLELQKKGGRAVGVETSLREVWTSCHFLDNQPQAYHPSLFIKSLHIHYLIKRTQQFFSFVCPFHNWRNWDWTKWNDLSAIKSHRKYENLRLSMLSPKRSPTLTRLWVPLMHLNQNLLIHISLCRESQERKEQGRRSLFHTNPSRSPE